MMAMDQPLHQEPCRLLMMEAMGAAHMVRCNERDHSLQLQHHWQLWQANERLVNDPDRVRRWRKGASFEYQGESCLLCFNMAGTDTQIPAEIATVKSATLRCTETRWLSLINRITLDWLSAPLCGLKVVS